MKHVSILCGQNAGILILNQMVYIYISHCGLKGYSDTGVFERRNVGKTLD
jgi:hypothetical protein